MGFYKNIFKKKIVIAGRSKGAKPSYLMPPDGTNVKQGFQVYEAIDLICEGEVEGFVNQEGKTLKGTRAKKDFNTENNVIGDSTLPIDQGIYFDDVALRDSSSSASAPGGNSVHSSYNLEFRSGRILQGKCNIVKNPSKLTKVSTPIKGPYSMTAIKATRYRSNGTSYQVITNNNGARKGTGSRDVRFEGTQGRNFVNWQNYVPREAAAKPYTYTNYDKDIGKVDIGLQIDGLSDTKSFSTKSENEAGKSKMGTPMPLTITFLVKVGKANSSGTETRSNGVFTVRPGKGKTVGKGNGKLSVKGIITAPYTITLENITLPTLSDTDLYNFIEVNKVEHETISNLIKRNAGVGTVTEKYLDTYYYPGSCYVASQIDSQYYPQLPARTFRLKGKKIKIPSNYHPINPNGTDRRFSKGSTARDSITSFRVTNNVDTSIANFGADDSVGNFTVFLSNVNGSKSWRDNSNGHTITKMVSQSNSSGIAIKYAWLYMDNDSVPQFTSSHIPGATSSSEDYPWEVEGFNGHWTRFDGSAGAKGFNKLIFSNFSPGFPSAKGMTIYDGDWDGTFKFGWSDNPAWIYYDLLTNRRYGLGSYLKDIDIIDKWTLFEIGMYCDAVTMNDGSKTTNDMGGAGKFIGLDDGFGGLEPRFSCNILIKDQTSAYDAIQNLARSFRAMTYFNNSCVSVRVDRPYFFEDFNNTTNEAPKENKFPTHLIFNNLNVKDGMFSYADVDRTTKLSAVEVSFLDKRNNFTAQTEYVEDPEAIKDVGLNFKQIEGVGVTSKAQAHRLAKYILFESQNTTETISFNAGFEALLIQPGDIIRIEDEMRNFHRNYGTVLGASGLTTYYDPDGGSANGEGPSAIIVEPAIGSDLTDYVTGGNIHIYNPVGKSGIEDFYQNPSSNNELYREIHNPQVMSLKIKDGGLNSSYKIIDSGVAIFINGLENVAGGSLPSQWFSEKDVNIRHGSIYNIDTSGINPKYYRVLNIEEDNNIGFNVSATIHHTGKFKFVEENISFDIDADTFQPNLTLTQINRPDKPLSVINEGFSNANADRSLNLNLKINDPTDGDKVGDKYVVILEEPDSTVIVSEHFKSNSSSTNITLSGNSKIDQIGEYTISVFSESTTPIIARSIDSTNINFTTEISDFSFGNQRFFTEYSNISINTDFTSTFDNSAETGRAQNSFFENDSDINAVVNLEFEDIFLNQGSDVLSTVTAQTINLLDSQGNLKVQNFKTLTNDDSFTITNAELNTAFQYQGDGRYQVPPSINFEVDSFQIPLETTSKTINFNTTFSEIPAIFTQQKHSGSFNTTLRPIARSGNGSTLFRVASENNQYETNYTYIASQTGNFVVDSKDIEIGFVTKNNTSAYQEVVFNKEFSSPPIVVIELQNAMSSSEEKVSETCITGVSTTKFSFKAFQQDNTAAGGAGQYAYIAVSESSFNNTTSSTFPTTTLNFAATGIENYSFGDAILNQFNGSESSVTDSRFNHDQYVVLCQRSGEDTDLEDKCFVVHETGGENRLYQQMLTSGLLDGIRSSQTNGSNNHILLTGGTLNGVGVKGVDTGDFTLFAWAKFEPNLNGKQYLLESHRNGTGIAWFQSGDGKNYVNLNGVDYLAITGSAGASLNDGNLHSLTINVRRDRYLDGHLDGVIIPKVRNNRILEQSTGFDVSNVGSGMPQNPHSFDGSYRRDGTTKSYSHTTASFSTKIKPSGSESTWILVDNDSSTPYAHAPIAWSGSEVVSSEVTSFRVVNTDGGDDADDTVGNFTANGTLMGSTKWLDNSNQHFIEKRVRPGFAGEYVWVYGDSNDSDPFFVSEVIQDATASSKEYPWNVDSKWAHFTLGGTTIEGFDELTFSNFKVSSQVLGGLGYSQNNLTSHSHPANVQNWTGAKFYTGLSVSNVGSGMKDNSHGSFDGTYTGHADLYVNETTSGLRIKKTGANNTWILCDDDPAHTYDHNRIAWSGGQNVKFPWNVSTWSGGPTITDGTITDSSAPGFNQLLSGKYAGTNAPSITNLQFETFDAQTGFKVLGNSELPGNALTSGHIKRYIALQSGFLGVNQLYLHHVLPDSFKSDQLVASIPTYGIKSSVNTKFLLDVDSQKFFEDSSTANTASGSIVGSVERSEAIINRNESSNFHFLQIGVTGTL